LTRARLFYCQRFYPASITGRVVNAPTIMVAEKGAAMIKGAARQRLAA
jgi:hypothetical protein